MTVILLLKVFVIVSVGSFALVTRSFNMKSYQHNIPKSNNMYMIGNLQKALKIGLSSLSISSITQVKKSYGISSLPLKATMKPTNDIVKEVNNIRFKRIGGSDILVSEIGLGTQRWYC